MKMLMLLSLIELHGALQPPPSGNCGPRLYQNHRPLSYKPELSIKGSTTSESEQTHAAGFCFVMKFHLTKQGSFYLLACFDLSFCVIFFLCSLPQKYYFPQTITRLKPFPRHSSASQSRGLLSNIKMPQIVGVTILVSFSTYSLHI